MPALTQNVEILHLTVQFAFIIIIYQLKVTGNSNRQTITRCGWLVG